MTLTGRAERLSRRVANLAKSSCVVTRRHSVTDRTSAKVATLILDGAHSEDDTALTLQNTAAAANLRGTIPEGLVLTIAGTDYTVAAEAEANNSNRIEVTITAGLVADAADETAVTLADAVTDTHPKVNLRPANRTEIDRGAAARVDVNTVASFPGHLAPRWVQQGDDVAYAMADGRTMGGRAALVDEVVWGQRVYS